MRRGGPATLAFVLLSACTDDAPQQSAPSAPDASIATADSGGGSDSGSGGNDGGTEAAATDGGTSGDPLALCAKYGGSTPLAFGATAHPQTNYPDANAAPAPQGGAVVDGIYDSTANNNWGNGTGTSGGNDKALLVLEGGAWFYRYAFDGVDDGNFAAGPYTIDVAGKKVTFGKSVCGGGGVPGSPNEPRGYTANATTFTTYLAQTVGPSQTPLVKEIVYQKR